MLKDSPQFVFPTGLATLLITLLACGCGAKDEATVNFIESLVPVTGTVTQKGSPVPGVMVIYFADSSSGTSASQASGLTDKDGKYSLLTYVPGSGNKSAPGAVPGDYRVMINKLVMPDGSPIPADTTDADAEALGARQLLPPKYSSDTATRLTAKVGAEPTVNDFALEK